jgi:glycerol-3-phosphate acyltransferase PlsY
MSSASSPAPAWTHERAWAATAAVSRISSLAALCATASTSVWLLVFAQGHMLFLVMILTILIYVKHAANIARLKAGTEPKIGAKS